VIIIAGYSLIEGEKRDAAVTAFADMVAQARKQDGCLDFFMSADSVDTNRMNLFECWRDEQCWSAWRKVAKGPKTKFGKMKSFVKLYRSEKAETVS
jgi:quinol monooxygenase YgiN